MHLEYAGIKGERNGNHDVLVEVVVVGGETGKYFQYDTLLPPLYKAEMDACPAKANRQLNRPALFLRVMEEQKKSYYISRRIIIAIWSLQRSKQSPCTRKLLFKIDWNPIWVQTKTI